MDNQKTMFYRPAPVLPATLLVVDCRCKPSVVPLRGDMSFGRIYNGPQCDIVVQSAIVGRRHGEFVYDDSEGVYYYIDN
ncbi:FHA domain-containing protein, partial [Lachnoclostridium sp. MSJ-17]|uniref:FHA domain-containing protein n=1 Tax=Lachnoclostridium sp. MSJ-17 TaxID=2841516 RepID=UPI001C0F8C36